MFKLLFILFSILHFNRLFAQNTSSLDNQAIPYIPPKTVKYGDNPNAGKKIKLKNAELYYEIYGQGEPILLLHGNTQSIRSFRNQIPELEKKYKVIAVDTRGQGKSEDFTTKALSYNLFANDMKQLLDSLHIKKTNLLGWSDGGNTGLIMAIKYPAYIKKLAIMGANLFPSNMAIDNNVINNVKSQLKELKHKTDEDSKMLTRLNNMLLNEPHISFESLKKIKIPVLVMAGQHDMVLEKHTKAIAQNISNSQLLIFKDATHFAPYEKVAEFNTAVLEFFDRD